MSNAFVLVGAPGSGKSTYAAKLAEIEDAVIISGDDVRTKR
jgi:adenylate kinase family enzyme